MTMTKLSMCVLVLVSVGTFAATTTPPPTPPAQPTTPPAQPTTQPSQPQPTATPPPQGTPAHQPSQPPPPSAAFQSPPQSQTSSPRYASFNVSTIAASIVKVFQERKCEPLLKLSDNDTIFYFMEKTSYLDEFKDLCGDAVDGSRNTTIVCNPVYHSDDEGAILCNSTTTFTRTGKTATFGSMWRVGWNVETHTMDYLDATIIDPDQFMEGYSTMGEQNFWQMMRALWLDGMEGLSDSVSDSTTFSLPNFFPKSLSFQGKQGLSQLAQNFLNNFDYFDVTDYDEVYGNDTMSVVRLSTVLIPSNSLKSLHRTLWLTTTFDNTGELKTFQLMSNKPLMFWDIYSWFGMDGDVFGSLDDNDNTFNNLFRNEDSEGEEGGEGGEGGQGKRMKRSFVGALRTRNGGQNNNNNDNNNNNTEANANANRTADYARLFGRGRAKGTQEQQPTTQPTQLAQPQPTRLGQQQPTTQPNQPTPPAPRP